MNGESDMMQASRGAAWRAGWEPASRAARLRAAGVHFLLSVSAALAVFGLAIAQWFPAPFLLASGGAGIAATIVAVDLVIGPLLTFMVFDRRKPELRRDLAVIAALQAAALAWGLHAATLARPVFMTFVVDRFEVVSAAEVDKEELRLAPPEYRSLPWSGPRLAGARRPDDPTERELLMFAGAHGIDLRHLLRHYAPFDALRAEAARRSKPLDELKAVNDPMRVDAVLADALSARGAAPLRWLPVQAKRRDLVALVDAASGELVTVVDLRPW